MDQRIKMMGQPIMIYKLGATILAGLIELKIVIWMTTKTKRRKHGTRVGIGLTMIRGNQRSPSLKNSTSNTKNINIGNKEGVHTKRTSLTRIETQSRRGFCLIHVVKREKRQRQ